MTSNNDCILDIKKATDYFLAMIRSYYPEYKPSELDMFIWNEACYEMFIIDNIKFENLREVIDFISMNQYWRQNITNLKQVRTRYHEIMRDIRAKKPILQKEIPHYTDGIVEKQIKDMLERRKKEAKKEETSS